jgi:MerR family transcriptional regulator, mercuric resistance operon regulatory protein
MQKLTIGKLAAAAGVNVETVRFYQRQQLLGEPPRALGGIRRYEQNDLATLVFIKRAQAMGFSLSEVATLMRLKSRKACHATRELAAVKLKKIDERITALTALRDELAQLIVSCDVNALPNECPLIEELSSAAALGLRPSKAKGKSGRSAGSIAKRN